RSIATHHAALAFTGSLRPSAFGEALRDDTPFLTNLSLGHIEWVSGTRDCIVAVRGAGGQCTSGFLARHCQARKPDLRLQESLSWSERRQLTLARISRPNLARKMQLGRVLVTVFVESAGRAVETSRTLEPLIAEAADGSESLHKEQEHERIE